MTNWWAVPTGSSPAGRRVAGRNLIVLYRAEVRFWNALMIYGPSRHLQSSESLFQLIEGLAKRLSTRG
jgi:hypothetical protein